MSVSIVIEKLVTTLIEYGYKLFNIKPKKDEEGFVVLKFPLSYYMIPLILLTVWLFLTYLLLISTTKHNLLVEICLNSFLLCCTLLSFFAIKNPEIKFNSSLIISRNVFKKTKTIFWNDCDFKPMNYFSQQIQIYNGETKINVHVKLLGFDQLLNFIEKRFLLSAKNLRINV